MDFGAGIMGAGSDLANRGGLSGSFFTGVLAVVVASPRTAPLMGTAWASPSPSRRRSLLVFAALGAGHGCPCWCWVAAPWRRLMPRPG